MKKLDLAVPRSRNQGCNDYVCFRHWEVIDTVSAAQQEIDRLHRRLWEKRRSAVWVQLIAMQTYFAARGMADRCNRAQMRMRKLELMEYKQ